MRLPDWLAERLESLWSLPVRWQWLKHAFAIEPPGPAVPTDPQRAAVERICQAIVRRRLTVAALVFLESARPLNYVGSQALHFFTPFISVLADAGEYRHLAAFLEQRGSVEYLCQRLEELESYAARRDQQSTEDDERNRSGQD